MFKKLKTVGFFALLFGLAGCAGKNFIRPASDTFQLGRTSYSQVVQQMGEHGEHGELRKNEKNIKIITYVYGSLDEPLERDVIPFRALTFYFYDDMLVGQEFKSSFKSDNSNFDNTRVESIKKGQTTRAEVIQLLGRPTASFIPPVVEATSGEAIGYQYVAVRTTSFGGTKSFKKMLLIYFDDKNLVSKLQYTSSGSK